MRVNRLVPFSLLITGFILLSSCAQATPHLDITPTQTLDGTLRPYPSETPSGTPLPTDYVSPTSSPTMTPTATSVYYNVRDGDDMYGIAFYYHISPQALMTANPTVNPRMMGPGTILLIPITPIPGATATATLALTPTATPFYKELHEPDCYFEASGGLWCFVLLENNEEGALENVSAEIILEQGENTRRETATMSLNLLPANSSIPLVAYFEPPIAAGYSVSAEVDFLLPVMPEDERYLPVDIIDLSITISEGGERAEVTGKVQIPENGLDARYLWINATAFDKDEHVVAVRRWQREDVLFAGEQLEFNVTLYSLGDAIDRVDVLAEAPANQQSDSEE